MLRSNLSTRPFYNERAVHAGLAIAAAIVLALTAVNLVRTVALSRQNTGLATQIDRDHAEAARLTQEAAAIRRGIDRDQLLRIVSAAGEANALIDQRTFSWTAFFNRLEATMPPDVMLTAVRPAFRDGQIRIGMDVLGRRAEDIDEFMERLEATGAFDEVLPVREDQTQQGLYRVALSVIYLAPATDSVEPDAPAAGPRGAAPPATAGNRAPDAREGGS